MRSRTASSRSCTPSMIEYFWCWCKCRCCWRKVLFVDSSNAFEGRVPYAPRLELIFRRSTWPLGELIRYLIYKRRVVRRCCYEQCYSSDTMQYSGTNDPPFCSFSEGQRVMLKHSRSGTSAGTPRSSALSMARSHELRPY